MNIDSKIDLLVDYAAQIALSNHKYIQKSADGRYQLVDCKENFNDFANFFNDINNQTIDTEEKQRQVKLCCDIIESHLHKKISGIFSFLIKHKDKERIKNLIAQIHQIKTNFAEAGGVPLTEKEARLRFYRDTVKKLNISKAPNGDEWEAIKILSQRIWSSQPLRYQEIMASIFQGEHVLIEEKVEGDQPHFGTYEALRQNCHAQLRTSSHYDQGKDPEGKVPKRADQTENPQYEIWGNHMKELLFGRVTLAVKEDESLIFGKTFKQAQALHQDKINPQKTRHFTWFQMEGARDTTNIFKLNFWRHRVRDYTTYLIRKSLKFEKANIGPYGYGHSDRKPTVIELLDNIQYP